MRKIISTDTSHILFALSEVLDIATPRLAKHQQRVALIAWQISKQIERMDQSRREGLFVAAMLHDIGELTIEGKIKIVTNKMYCLGLSGHAETGAYLFSLLPWLSSFKDIVRYHHTKWNNYNCSIDAPFVLEAQILHLADRVDILIDKDEYILHQDEGIKNYVMEQENISFHPIVVDAFFEATKHEEFWLDITIPNTDVLLKEVVYNAKIISVDEMLEISEFIRMLIDFKSNFTATHSAGVAESAAYLSKLLNFPETQIKRMRIAGNLHDIGKLNVPNAILEKNGKLTTAEYAIVRRHTYYTYMTLKNVRGLRDVVEWAAYHHEKLDGSGYPFGLSETELCLEARIMAVADIFTALIENRPYRQGMVKEQVLTILNEQVIENKLDKSVIKILTDNFDDCLQHVKHKQSQAQQQYKLMMSVKNQIGNQRENLS